MRNWKLFLLVACAAVLGACASGPGVAGRATPGRPAAMNPDRAFQWRRLAWLDEQGRIAPGAYRRAVAQRAAMIDAQGGAVAGAGITAQSWTSRGPDNIGGRTRSLLIHPADSDLLFAGSVSGGIWRSGDGGLHWAQVNDNLPNLAIGSMAFDPKDPLVIYAGTGEGVFNGDAIGGIGIYKSTDGGQTFALMPATKGWENVCAIAVSPTNSNVILAGTRYGGVQRTTNGGASWSNPIWAQGCFDIDFHPTDGTRAVAHLIDYDWGKGDWYHHAIFTTNAGLSWQNSTGSLSAVYGFSSRIALAYARSSPNIVYAACGGDGKVHKSTDGGHSFAPVTTDGSTQTSWYCGPFWVDPTNPSVMLAGGGGLVRSADGGVTLTSISAGYINTVDPHPDIQYITADPGFDGVTNKRVYICTDGGVYRTDDVYTAGPNYGWERLDQTYRTTQFYGAAGHGGSGRLYGGTQDNGSLLLNPGSDIAAVPFGGDGGFCAIDPGNPDYLYGEYITLQIHRSTNGGGSAKYIVGGLSDAGTAANFIAPFILDPNFPQVMLAGGASLWRCTNVKVKTPTWTAIRPPGSSYISAIAVAPGHSNVVWIAQNDAKVYRTLTGQQQAPTWLTVDDNGALDPLPNRYVTRILIDPDDQDTVYVCLGGFTDSNLLKTTDGGATWADITGDGPTGLPFATIRGVARHPTHAGWLYVATEVGIFTTEDGGAHWSTTNDGPANVSVDEIVFLSGSTTLLAATHGRGLFTAPVVDCRPDLNLDGVLDIDDFIEFQTLFGSGDARADFDGSGGLDIDDFVAFQTAFGVGCG